MGAGSIWSNTFFESGSVTFALEAALSPPEFASSRRVGALGVTGARRRRDQHVDRAHQPGVRPTEQEDRRGGAGALIVTDPGTGPEARPIS